MILVELRSAIPVLSHSLWLSFKRHGLCSLSHSSWTRFGHRSTSADLHGARSRYLQACQKLSCQSVISQCFEPGSCCAGSWCFHYHVTQEEERGAWDIATSCVAGRTAASPHRLSPPGVQLQTHWGNCTIQRYITETSSKYSPSKEIIRHLISWVCDFKG